MQIDEFLELVKRRRSIRRFKPDPIPDEYVEKIIEAARWAMSGANGQPWEFIVVKDQKVKNAVLDTWSEAKGETYSIEQTRIEELRHNLFLKPHAIPGFKEAPVLIFVCGDTRTLMASVLSGRFLGGRGTAGDTYIKNIANATQNLHLAAAALGLGAAWISVGHIWEQLLKPILDVPPAIDIHTIVPIGYPAYQPKPNYRREFKEIVHFDKYDRSRYRSADDVIRFIRDLRARTRPAYQQEKVS